jgi:hypothetical protein
MFVLGYIEINIFLTQYHMSLMDFVVPLTAVAEV